MSYQLLTQTLIESFNALADEVQALSDRKTILEHKLRYAHEQFQFIADKHAPADTSISETLAHLQIPPELHAPSLTDAVRVPLPSRAKSPQDSRHKTALVIRDGRRASQQLAALVEASKSSSSRDVFSRRSHSPSSMPTDLEQDFTVEGKKGSLACPFSRPAPPPPPAENERVEAGGNEADAGAEAGGDNPPNDPTPHHSADPICAAMFEETTHTAAPPTDAAAAKCPIRYMGEHSPEEIAHYVETHKHEIPRSHEICVSRYQRNEEEIRKLDAKYGNIVSMIQVLSQLHTPMLPSAASAREGKSRQRDLDMASNERVESWAQGVSASTPQMEDVERAGDEAAAQTVAINGDNDSDRVGRFDRPLKEIRVGESPTRPWGISVPVGQPYDQDKGGPPLSPPPAPVVTMGTVPVAETPTRKCPFDHTKFMPPRVPDPTTNGPPLSPQPRTAFSPHETPAPPSMHNPSGYSPSASNKPFSQPQFSAPPPQPPAFVNPPPPASHAHAEQQSAAAAAAAAAKQGFPPAQGAPQMVFTGPVFIGYPVEQAMQIMSQWRGGN